MRPLSLTLNGQPADLPTTTKGLVKLTQTRAALADPSARVGEYSFPLTLPPTRTNAVLFGPDKLHELGLGKFGFYIDYAYELRVGGEVFAGVFRLTSLKNGYTGTLIGEGLSWALLLGDKKLTELEFTPIDYDGSQLEAILALDCDATDLQFPLVAYGNFFAPPETRTLPDGSTEEVPAPPSARLTYPLAVDDYLPSVYYPNVLRQIFASIGWQLRGRELDSEVWRSTVMLPAGANVGAAWNWGRLLQAEATSPGGQSVSYYQSGPAPGYTNNAAGFYTLPGDGPELSGDIFFLPVAQRVPVLLPTRALELASATYTAPRAGVYDFAWEADLVSGYNNFGGPNIDSHDTFVAALLRPIGLGLVVCRGGQGFDNCEGGLLRGDPNAGPLNYATGQDSVLTPKRLDAPGAGLGGLGQLVLGKYSDEVSGLYLEAGDSVTLAVFARRCVFDGSNNLLAYRSQAVYNFGPARLACTRYADNNGVSKELLQPADFLPPLSCRDVVKDFLVRVNGFIVADPAKRVATLYGRDELSQAAGEPLDLSERVNLEAVEYLPSAGAGVGSYVFSPAVLSDDPLVLVTADVVTASVGPGDTAKSVTSLFAVAGFRTYYGHAGALPLPCCASADLLAQNCSEVEWDPSSQAPRLLRYVGADASLPVPFMRRTVPLAGAAWDGPLGWDGEAGAVATYYASTIKRALTGHLARVQAPLTPALYQGLTAGRRVYLFGAPYTVELTQNFDPSDEAALAQVDLSREVL
jgi:hypothetical protein